MIKYEMMRKKSFFAILPVVRKLNRKLEVSLHEERHDALQIVFALPADADLIIHDLRLHLEFRILYHFRDEFCVFFIDSVLKLDDLAHGTARG